MENDKNLSEQFFSAILDIFVEAVILTNKRGTILFINRETERLISNESTNIIGRNLSDIILIESEGERLKSNFKNFLHYLHSSKSSFLFNTSPTLKIPIKLTAKNIGRGRSDLLFILKPITEKNEPNKPHSPLQKVWDSYPDAMRLTDENGMIVAVNKAFCELIGADQDFLLNSHFTEMYGGNIDKKVYHKRYIKRFRKNNMLTQFQQKFILRNGRSKFMHIVNSFLNFGNGKRQLLTIFRDITEQKSFENSLLNQKSKSQCSFDLADAVIVEIDNTNIVKMINKKGCDVLNLSSNQIIGKNWLEYFIPEDERENIKNYFSTSHDLLNEPLGYYRHSMQSLQGNKILMDWHYFSIYDDQNNLLTILGSGVDISNSTKKENALYETEERLTSMFESSVDVVYILNLKGNLTYVNDAAEVMTGILKNELIGTNYKSFIAKKDQHWIFRTFQGIYQSGKSFRGLQFEIHTKNGGRIFLETSVSPIRCDDQTVGFSCISRDVTLREQTERALLESEERFRSVAETAGEAIISINNEGIIIFWNRAAEQIFKYSADEAIGMPLSIIIPENLRYFHDEKFRKTLQDNNDLTRQGFRKLRAVRKNGEEFPIEISRASWKLKDDIYFTTIIRDVTQRLKDEHEREVLYKIVENINTSDSFEKMLENIYQNIKRILFAENCYIALYNADDDSLSFPLFSDQKDRIPKPGKCRNGITEHILKTGKQLLLNTTEFQNLIEQKYIEPIGTIPYSWLGVPLFIKSKPKGVLAIKSYSEHYSYTEHDKKLLLTIGSQVGFAIERKQAYDAIRISESRFRAVIDTAQDGIFLKNKEHKYTQVNAILAKFFNLSKRDFIGKTDTDLFGVNVGKYTYQKDQAVLNGNIIQTEETGNYNNQLVTFHVIKYPIKDVDGKIIGLCGIARDITVRKKMENAIEEERERLRTTLKSIGDGVITTDLHDNVVLINRAAEKMVGWLQDDAVGKKIDKIFHTIDEDTANTDQVDLDLLVKANKIFSKGQYSILESRDGSRRIITHSHSKIRDKANHVLGAVHVFRDETETIKFRDEQQKADKLESIGMLAGGIAHDFNNLLTAILSNVSLVKFESDPAGETYEILSEVEKASLRARDLTQQLLTFSKGGLPVKKKISIAELIKESAEFALSGSNVNCNYHFADNLSLVEVDIGQISQVINNLIINADEAMPGGGIIDLIVENTYLESNQFPGIKRGNFVKIVIQDHGIGINNSNLAKIFDPYFSTKQKGSGLGLATCYAIIKKHQGFIGVDSELGQGTRFIIYLPASTTEPGGKIQAKDSIIRGTGKILLMDDEELIRDAAGKLLSHLGYEVVFACTGQDAITFYQNARESGESFDAVILDLTVPGAMGGKDCIKQLRKIDPNICAIVSSGYSNDPIMAAYQDYGFKGVAKKPYRITELGEILHDALENR